MKAVFYNKEKEFVVVGDRNLPQPASGEVFVQLKSAALNHRELNVISNFNKQQSTEDHEFIFGSDGAGIIVGLGENTSPWKLGDEVIIDSTVACGECEAYRNNEVCPHINVIGVKEYNGTFAEYIKVPITNLLKKPPYLDFQEASSLSLGLGTAWRSLVTKGKIQKGETILIHGIGGGVALYALQLAVHLGAHVIVTSSSADKLMTAREIGASKAINYHTENVVEEVLSYTNGKGVDVIIDGVGVSTFKMNIEMAARKARIITFGYTNSNVPTLELNNIYQLYEKELIFLEGSVHINRDEIENALSFWTEHSLRPYVSHSYKLEEIVKAYDILKSGKQFGKIVVTMD